jgi:hypothetical protein
MGILKTFSSLGDAAKKNMSVLAQKLGQLQLPAGPADPRAAPAGAADTQPLVGIASTVSTAIVIMILLPTRSPSSPHSLVHTHRLHHLTHSCTHSCTHSQEEDGGEVISFEETYRGHHFLDDYEDDARARRRPAAEGSAL